MPIPDTKARKPRRTRKSITRAAFTGSGSELIDQFIGNLPAPNAVLQVDLDGKILEFKPLVDRAQHTALMNRTKQFVAGATPEKCVNQEIKEYYDTDDETKIFAHMLADLSITPKFTANDLLRLAKRNCYCFDELIKQYLLALAGITAKAEKDGIENAKNG